MSKRRKEKTWEEIEEELFWEDRDGWRSKVVRRHTLRWKLRKKKKN
jgi:hypothetical protein